MTVEEQRPEFRETAYDVEAAAVEIRGSGFPDPDGQLAESLVAPADPDWVTAIFEQARGGLLIPDLRPDVHLPVESTSSRGSRLAL